jgi:large subunit ribosomal protein L25
VERITIKAETRAEAGKGVARSLRRNNSIPAVLYREGKSTPIKLNKIELTRFLQKTAGEQVVVNLEFPDGQSRLALVKDYQVDPVRRELLHTDFFEVSLKEAIKVVVAVRVIGEPIGVKRDGGILQHGIDEIEVECLPDQIPGHIDVDVSGLGTGQAIHVGDIKLAEGLKVVTPATDVIATVVLPVKVEEVAAPVTEEVEPEVIKKGKAAEEGEEKEEKKEEKKEK